MNEQMYTPEEVAIKVLDKVKTLYQGSALYKSNTAHEVEGGDPVSEDAECPESLSAENSEAVKDEDKKEKKKKGADSVSETSETSENSVAAENEMAENIEFEEQPDEDVDSFEPDHEKDMAPDEEKEHDAAENEADEADADTIEADEEIGDAEENSRKDIKAVTKDKKKKDKDVEKSENLAKGCGATPMKKWAGKATERTMPFNPSKDKVKERTMPFNPLKDKVKERTMPYKPSKVEAQNIDIKKPKSSKLGSFLKLRKKRHLDKNMMPKDEKQEKVGIKRQQKPQDLPKGPSNIGY